MNWSQDYSVKSNARRAARKAGVPIGEVKGFVKAGQPTVYRFPLLADGGVAAPDDVHRIFSEHAAGKSERAIAAGLARDGTKKAKAAKPKAAKKAKAAKRKAAKKAKAAKPKAKGKRGENGAKLDLVASMLRKSGGAAISAVCKATDWLPHTARARISVDVAKLLGKGEEIARRREEGESHYAIVKSRQLALPKI
jgi:hypothetical protein